MTKQALTMHLSNGLSALWLCVGVGVGGIACDGANADPPTTDDPRAGVLRINEVMPSNTTTCLDEAGEADDWLELFNSGSDEMALDGITLTDDRTTPAKASLDGLVVPGGGVLLLWADGTVAQGADHLPFKLSAAGEEAVLFIGDAIIDELTWTTAVTDVSTARFPDGGDGIASCAAATCGALNGASCQ